MRSSRGHREPAMDFQRKDDGKGEVLCRSESHSPRNVVSEDRHQRCEGEKEDGREEE